MPTRVHESTSHRLSREWTCCTSSVTHGVPSPTWTLKTLWIQKKKFKRGSWVVECCCSIMGGSTKQSYTKLPVFTVQMCEKLYNWLVAVNSFSQHWLSILTNKSRVSHTPSENGHILHEATVHIYFLQSTVIFKVKLFWSSRTRFFWGRFLSFTFAI